MSGNAVSADTGALDAARQEAISLEAGLMAARQEVVRLETDLNAARVTVARQEGMLDAARQEAMLDAARQEVDPAAARRQAAWEEATNRVRTARREVFKIETTLDTARREVDRQEARLAAARQEIGRREARLALAGEEVPGMLAELAKPQNQRSNGRQRLAAAQPPRQPRPRLTVDDDPEYQHLRPDPRKARTGAELTAALRKFRQWSGEPSLSEMAERSGQLVSRSSLHRALNSRALPSFDAVMAVVTGCGGAEEDRKKFASAWRMIRSGIDRQAAHPPLHPPLHPVSAARAG